MSSELKTIQGDLLSVDDGDDTRIDGRGRASAESLDVPDFRSVFQSESAAPRYELRRLLGEGGYGRVYTAFDRDLEREVALKVVTPPPGVERDLFIREARVTAGLVHPNIPAVYDVAERNGTFFLSMQQVSGQSLSSLIRAAASEGAIEVMAPVTLMEVLLKVADALEYAHAEGVVHRDVKPANIVIGSFGEVMLVDWGAAHYFQHAVEGREFVIGTPTYMAPEQLNGGTPTAAADIYGLGATLFHALLLRVPLARAESQRFWQRKARGSIDPPTSAELARAPRALLGIAMKAMSALARDRYPSMKAFGEAVRDVLVGRKAWLAPLREGLNDDSYRERWVSIPEGAFERRGERLVSTGPGGCLLLYKQRLNAGVALEFEGEILPGERPGDLSIVWTEDDVLEPAPHWPTRATISLQVGAFDNLAIGIYRDFVQCLQGRSLSIDVGRSHLIRAEVDEQAFRLYLDGKLITEYEQLFSTPSGYIAIYSYAPGKAFSNIRLFERAVPEKISPNAVGDAFYTREQYAAAAVHYARVEQCFSGTELAEEAAFKRGLCCLRDGHPAVAKDLWGALRAEHWVTRASLHLMDLKFQVEAHSEVIADLNQLLLRSTNSKALIIDRWVQYVNSLCKRDFRELEHYAEVRERHFADDPGSAAAAASLELARGAFSSVVERYPEQHTQHFDALCALARFSEVSERYHAIPWMNEMARVYLNRFDEVRHDESRALAYALRGEMEAALSLGDCVEALLPARRYDQVLGNPYTAPADYAAALRGLGRVHEAAARGDGRALCQLDVGEEALASALVLPERLYFVQHLAFRSFSRGDWAGFLRHSSAARALPCSAVWSDVWLPRHFLFAILEQEHGDAGALERSARRVIDQFSLHWHGKAFHLARFLLDEADLADFEAQPVRMFMRGRAIFARALRADSRGDARSASAFYREYLDLPEEERFTDSPRRDPLLERWSAFRAAKSAAVSGGDARAS